MPEINEYSIENEFTFYGIEFWSYKTKTGKWAYSYENGESFVTGFPTEDEATKHASEYALETASDRASDMA